MIGYLQSEHYISARATWINMQKEMGRTRITDGRPKSAGRGNHMRSRAEIAREAIEDIRKGIHPYETMKRYGYPNPAKAWAGIRNWLRDEKEEIFRQIPKEYRDMRTRRPENEIRFGSAAAEKPGKAPEVKTLALKGGENYQLKVEESMAEDRELEVAAVYSRVREGCTYRKTGNGMALLGHENSMVMSAEEWEDFRDEIRQAMTQLNAAPGKAEGEE